MGYFHHTISRTKRERKLDGGTEENRRMRTLTLTVDEAWNGSTVKHLLRARLHMAEGLIARVKLR